MDSGFAPAWQHRKRTLLFEVGAGPLKFSLMLRLRVIVMFAGRLALLDPL
jgi:hypothetical protein